MNLKRIIAVTLICIISAVTASCDDDSSGSQRKSSNGICQFDGCTKKATSIGGEFCDYHSKALDDYWDSQRALNDY